MLYTHYEKTNKYPRILVCAPSNNAVDEIAARLMHVRDARKSNYHSKYWNVEVIKVTG
jgi:hypothetical protein